MATSKSTPHAPADAVTHSPAPGHTIPEVEKLREKVESMDCLSQDGFTTISTIAKLVLDRLETPAGHNGLEYLATALELIWNKAEDIQDRINSEAEQVGCNYTDKARDRRWAARRQAQELREEVQHG